MNGAWGGHVYGVRRRAYVEGKDMHERNMSALGLDFARMRRQGAKSGSERYGRPVSAPQSQADAGCRDGQRKSAGLRREHQECDV